ncbi:nicotinate-nucleotide adenylyltransferase [Thalassotalea sp. ND16A]|uniref:nicotinate-nucleotide adenylyltransferase n=1 Tax=Thalassotalea sp. ND16A TaxID=1535422 RepID=UPI00051D2A68|nr:nicotinate-nucleotide adenylyltransferase [Thalassotalea sp. ND16A]KGJ97185.1 Nicotinate-nucleotide adenylyltransferase [Thalassotalea sp. ND16A]
MPNTERTNRPAAPANIGIFGGTFDPIHLGHIHSSMDAARQLDFDRILLIPAHLPPHKAGTHASASQRKQMVALVCAHFDIFKLDSRELERTTPSYTIDSVTELKQQHPNSKLFFFIGTDSLINLPSWHQIKELVELCHFVVSTRPGYCPASLQDEFFKNKLTDDIALVKQKSAGCILLLETCQLDISSTQIREMLKNGDSVSQYLSTEVAQFVDENGIYPEQNSRTK